MYQEKKANRMEKLKKQRGKVMFKPKKKASAPNPLSQRRSDKKQKSESE
jgi:hypothetical protein